MWGNGMIEKPDSMQKAELLFKGWSETVIWSCLQKVMGEIYVDNRRNPVSAMALLGDFCFLAGKPEEELVLYKPEECEKDFIIMIPQNDGWAELIEKCYGKQAKKVIRYAMKKEPDVFVKEKLQKIVDSLPQEYSLKRIDEKIYHWCRKENWCRDWVAQYTDYEVYRKYGLGVVVLKDGVPVSGASSYSSYRGGIEIEIDTEEKYRRKGLASVCGAKLILECLEKKWYPSWDAQNQWSAALARKLGYHCDYAYAAYEIWQY